MTPQPFEWIYIVIGLFIALMGVYTLVASKAGMPGTKQIGSGAPVPAKRVLFRGIAYIFMGLSFVSFALADDSAGSTWGWLGAVLAIVAVVFLVLAILNRLQADAD